MPSFVCHICQREHTCASSLRRHLVRQHHGAKSGPIDGIMRQSNALSASAPEYAGLVNSIKELTTLAVREAFRLPAEAAVKEVLQRVLVICRCLTLFSLIYSIFTLR